MTVLRGGGSLAQITLWAKYKGLKSLFGSLFAIFAD
jgi:hypothetical protein